MSLMETLAENITSKKEKIVYAYEKLLPLWRQIRIYNILEAFYDVLDVGYIKRYSSNGLDLEKLIEYISLIKNSPIPNVTEQELATMPKRDYWKKQKYIEILFARTDDYEILF
ncbi:hypothetical protein [Spiroplasma sp. DGKH1]|uniref:hypothetical protein n=1 Tax=Spiroplasma sp. DGKH1 TaxID=3050074 RepID=UPI0034C5DD0D